MGTDINADLGHVPADSSDQQRAELIEPLATMLHPS